jgi:hypothetical protein
MPDYSSQYNLPFPLATDSVDVHGDIKDLVEALAEALPTASYSQLEVENVSGSTINAGDPVFISGYNTKTRVSRATSSTTLPILGLAKSEILNNGSGIIVVSGVLSGVNTSGFTAGNILYAGVSGGLTATTDAGGAVGIVAHAASSGVIIVEAKGNGTWGALKAGLA